MNERKHISEVFNQKAVVGYYDVLAKRYGLSSPEQQLIEQYCLAGKNLLVQGCGPGREIFPLRKTGLFLMGLDLAWCMLCKAMETRRQLQADCPHFLQGDSVSLPYLTESIDSILMLSQLIQHIPTRKMRCQALGESLRVLKPGGHLILSAYNKPISLLYIVLSMRKHRRQFRFQEHTSGERPQEGNRWDRVEDMLAEFQQRCSQRSAQHIIFRLGLRISRRIRWEIFPEIWSFSDPLPLTHRALFSIQRVIMNLTRIFTNSFLPHTNNRLEANDYFLPAFPKQGSDFFPGRGELFIHFPDVDEMLEDIDAAGFKLVEYKSLEELQQGQEFSEEERRKKRLLFYVAQKV